MTTTNLPPEVWHIIFRLAAGPLLPHALGPLFLSPFDVFVDLDTHWRMLGGRDFTRTSLVLVCRSWHIMATPYIYEQIVIKTSEQERLLLRTLGSSKHRLDHFIKAIFIGVGPYIGRPSAETSIANSSIMKYLSRLKVYGIRCSHIEAHSMGCAGLKALSPPAACHPTSMIIHVQCGILPASLHHFLESASTYLRILELSLPSSTDQAKHDRTLLLPNLHTLTIIGGGDAAALLDVARHWLVPSLQCIRGLGYTASFPLTNFSSSSQPSQVIPRITSLAFSGPRVCNNFYEIFPDVEEIVFNVDVGRNPVMIMRPVPTCTRVGIVCEVQGKQRRRLEAAILDQLTPLGNPVTFPNIRLIRVMFVPARDQWIRQDSQPSVTFFSDYNRRCFWAYWKKLWASRGVILEATEPHTGIPVPDTLELGESSEELANAYGGLWDLSHLGYGEDSSLDSRSEDSWSEGESDLSSLSDENEKTTKVYD